MIENRFSTEGDILIKYTLKINGVIPAIGSVPFTLRYYNPLDEKKYYEASYDGTDYINITPENDYYVIAIDNVELLPGRMFCWEKIMVDSIYHEDGKRTESFRYDIGEIVRIVDQSENLNTQTNFAQGIWFNYRSIFADVLPEIGIENAIYFIPNGENTDLYIYTEGNWTIVGNTNIDFSNYFTKIEINSILENYIQKIPNQRLITEEEAIKLDSAITSEELSAGLSTKVTAVANQRLITEQEATKLASAITIQELEAGLNTKVTAVPDQRLITDAEALKLASSVISTDLEPYSLKDTEVLEEAVDVPKEEKQYIKFFDEVNGIERKISMPNFILGASNPVYPTARALVGEKNGSNETFTSEYNYIAGSEKLNINGSIYYPNSGFYKEGNKIILSGAPIPEAGDFMFLEAIYLD